VTDLVAELRKRADSLATAARVAEERLRNRQPVIVEGFGDVLAAVDAWKCRAAEIREAADMVAADPLYTAAPELLAKLTAAFCNIHHDDGRMCWQPQFGTGYPAGEHHPVVLLIEKASGIPHHCHCSEPLTFYRETLP
jgi:hypothetical protein